LEKGRAQSDRELFLDTTYILPFFQVPIAVEGFELTDFKVLIGSLSKVHVAELSIYEAKAKLMRLSKAGSGYDQALRAFGRNLNVLRLDEKFVFHNYTEEDDGYFNQLPPSTERLDAFDLLIMSQAFTVGELLTEDGEILTFRGSDRFTKSPLSKSIRIRCWKEIAKKKSEHK